ncbi:TIGR03943 family putative permease subunit [Streptomyces sporangiiformans]|uniref:TIGR03943 family protein n=1 Tax=Streptomyces sporangiiformans TaxID=2315329 RepID=A0A505DNC5_9ACTN|nr:TIGR03943 family protein [Streptomyces sporangiiformans]TPQ21721.1 TIGR03943 family protein [Streptomyces sporangiiformans]
MQEVLLLLCGAALLRISLFSELYLRYVKEGLRPYLITSGVLLIVLGMLSMARRVDPEDRDPEDKDPEDEGTEDEDTEDHGHDHTRGPRIAWLLAAPALALLLFPPPALGSYSADREEAKVAAQGVGTFPELPPGPAEDPVDLTLGSFASRAQWDSGASMKGRTLRLTGFVTRHSNGDGDDGGNGNGNGNGTWYVARLLVSCCAADAQALKVQIRGAEAPAADTWVTVTGTWHPTGKPGSNEARPVLDATSVRHVKQPSNPYEKR